MTKRPKNPLKLPQNRVLRVSYRVVRAQSLGCKAAKRATKSRLRATIKGGGRPTRLLPHAKMLLIPIEVFLSAG